MVCRPTVDFVLGEFWLALNDQKTYEIAVKSGDLSDFIAVAVFGWIDSPLECRNCEANLQNPINKLKNISNIDFMRHVNMGECVGKGAYW